MLLTYVLIFALFYGKTKGGSYQEVIQNTSPNNREHMTKQECDKN